jgi:hypothetical protein
MNTLIVAGFFIPGMGPRVASVALCFNDEELNKAFSKIGAYIERTGFEELTIETIELDQLTNEFVRELHERVTEQYRKNHKEGGVEHEDDPWGCVDPSVPMPEVPF